MDIGQILGAKTGIWIIIIKRDEEQCTRATVRNKIRILSILHRLRLQLGVQGGGSREGGLGCLGLADEVCTNPSIHNFGLEGSPSEGRPPLSNTSSEAGALHLEVRIKNDSD